MHKKFFGFGFICHFCLRNFFCHFFFFYQVKPRFEPAIFCFQALLLTTKPIRRCHIVRGLWIRCCCRNYMNCIRSVGTENHPFCQCLPKKFISVYTFQKNWKLSVTTVFSVKRYGLWEIPSISTVFFSVLLDIFVKTVNSVLCPISLISLFLTCLLHVIEFLSHPISQWRFN